MGARAGVMNSVLQKFLVGKEEHKAKDNTELLRVRYINGDLPHSFSPGLKDKLRPDLSYQNSKIQSAFENACVRDSRECIYIVEYAASASTRGILFLPDSSWDTAIVVRFSDGSFCQEQEQLDGVTQNNKPISQHRSLVTALNAARMLIHPLSWSLTGIRRVCRSSNG